MINLGSCVHEEYKLLPACKPSARRFEHLVSEQSALPVLGGLSASRLGQHGPQQTAQLGTLSWRVPFAPWLAPVPRQQAARGECPQPVRVQREIRGLAFLFFLRVLPSCERS